MYTLLPGIGANSAGQRETLKSILAAVSFNRTLTYPTLPLRYPTHQHMHTCGVADLFGMNNNNQGGLGTQTPGGTKFMTGTY